MSKERCKVHKQEIENIRRGIKLFKVESEVVTVMMMNTAVFWHTTPRRSVERHLCFTENYCLHHQGTLKTNGSTRMMEKSGNGNRSGKLVEICF
jgi:hypothetical protein